MSTLPPPPAPGTYPAPPKGAPDDALVRIPRPGELTAPWRTTLLVAWVGIVLVYASVWRTARTMGLSTWWLGPSAEPRAFVVQLLPFFAPLAMIIAASRPTRYLPIAGIAAGVIGALIGIGDLGRFDRLALLELAAAGSGLLVSVASIAGMLRSEPEVDRSIP